MPHHSLVSLAAALSYPDIDPVIFNIGPIAIRWYSMAYVVGLIVGIAIMKRIARDIPASCTRLSARVCCSWR